MRYQRGNLIPITLVTAGKPDALPVATITDPNNALFGQFAVPCDFADPTPNTFDFSYRLGPGASLGTYQVAFTYSVAGVVNTQTTSFDVVPGGDSGGEVISLYAYDRPEARYILAQLGSGKIVQGRNPHL